MKALLPALLLAAVLPAAAQTTCTHTGSATFCSDGKTYIHSGNTTFGSDGSSAIRSGNSTFIQPAPVYVQPPPVYQPIQPIQPLGSRCGYTSSGRYVCQ